MRFVLCLLLALPALVAAQTPLGPFASGLDGPRDIIQLADGCVLVSDTDAGEIRAYLPDGTDLGTFTTLDRPYGMVQLTDGRILVSASSEEVVAYSASGESLGLFAEDLQDPRGLLQMADGRVLVAEFGFTDQGRVTAFDDGGAFLRRFARQLESPQDLVQTDDNRILVVEAQGEIEVFDPVGNPLGNFAEPGAPTAAIQLDDGRILVPTTIGPAPNIRAYSRAGTFLTIFAENLSSPRGLTQLEDGRVLVTEASSGDIEAFGVIPVASETEPEDVAVSTLHPNPVRISTPTALTVTRAAPGTLTMTVFSATGREVSHQTLALSPGRQFIEIETETLGPGLYAVRVVGPGVRAVRRLVVVR